MNMNKEELEEYIEHLRACYNEGLAITLSHERNIASSENGTLDYGDTQWVTFKIKSNDQE